jgi:hypothetical protein
MEIEFFQMETYSSMGESMEEPPSLNMLVFDNNVTIASTRSGCDNILVEGKGNENDERK